MFPTRIYYADNVRYFMRKQGDPTRPNSNKRLMRLEKDKHHGEYTDENQQPSFFRLISIKGRNKRKAKTTNMQGD